MSSSLDIEDLLTSFWRLDVCEHRQSRHTLESMHVTISSLTEQYLRSRIDLCKIATKIDHDGAENAITSLTSLASAKIIDSLAASDNIQSDILTIANSLTTETLRQLFRDGRLPYVVLRDFLDLPLGFKSGQTMATLQDVDEAVMRNEAHVRSRSAKDNQDARYLVTLESLGKILGKSPSDPSATVTFRRKQPPPGGVEYYDHARERTATINITEKAYSETFQRITRGVLDGLEWNNVLVAGGIALITLLHTDKSKDDLPEVVDSDIDIYLYGLDAAQANTKVQEIYEVWKRNLPATDQRVLVVKNAKTITFLTNYPNRRIHIVLKLLLSPTQILLNFDLDACAVGFDGSQVWMLPRCARAIETGFNVFTMDLIWGHYFGNRRASREARIIKYADRGFGMRILPSYVRSLKHNLATEHSQEANTNDDSVSSEGLQTQAYSAPRRKYPNRDAYRLPEGPEPGLKTLRRVAYIGEDFTNRFCFGNTPLHRPSEAVIRSHPGTWIDDYEARKEHTRKRIEEVEQRPLAVATFPHRWWSMAELDNMQTHGHIPDGQSGLGQFEMLIRHAEAWNLTRRRLAHFDFDTPHEGNMGYGNEFYDDTRGYEWSSKFSIQYYIARMNAENDRLFDKLKAAVSTKLSIPYQEFGYSGYLTRRIRRQVYGPDVNSVMRKQITIPLMVPLDLETFLLGGLPNLHPDLPAHYLSNPFLIPVHDPNNRPANGPQPSLLPSLQDAASEAGNLRFWVITNKSMWACQDRVMDEVFEVLWTLFYWFQQGEREQNVMPAQTCDSFHAVWHMALAFRRRAVDPPEAAPPRSHNDKLVRQALEQSGLTPREAMLFRAWAFAEPDCTDRTWAPAACPFFEEDGIMYPVPDELFWKDGDEGDSGEYVPQWTDWPVETDGQKRKFDTVESSRIDASRAGSGD